MSHSINQQVFQLCSYLLSYPTQEFMNSLCDVDEELNLLTSAAIKEELQAFSLKARNFSFTELVSTYINTFDFGKKTNLYITYMSNGEQRERGMELLFLKDFYKSHGFHVTDKELPDYLPIILEFASQVEQKISNVVFERYYANIEEIAAHLDPDNNLYGHIFKALLSAFHQADIKKTVQRSEEECSNNFYGSFSPMLP